MPLYYFRLMMLFASLRTLRFSFAFFRYFRAMPMDAAAMPPCCHADTPCRCFSLIFSAALIAAAFDAAFMLTLRRRRRLLLSYFRRH